MTSQIPDEFIYDGEPFSLDVLKVRICTFGIESYFSSTACYRGYTMRYIFTKDELILDRMHINANDPPKLNGVEPQIKD